MNIEREAFRTWLQGKPATEIVGDSQNGDHCPAANYLKTLPGIKFEHIDSRDLFTEKKLEGSNVTISHRNDVPPWLGMFIKQVDALDSTQISVTASAALACLDEVPQTFGEHVRCHAGQDGECCWTGCPQLVDGEPVKSGRHCPLDIPEEDD